jgi:hypothetical protein
MYHRLSQGWEGEQSYSFALCKILTISFPYKKHARSTTAIKGNLKLKTLASHLITVKNIANYMYGPHWVLPGFLTTLRLCIIWNCGIPYNSSFTHW